LEKLLLLVQPNTLLLPLTSVARRLKWERLGIFTTPVTLFYGGDASSIKGDKATDGRG